MKQKEKITIYSIKSAMTNGRIEKLEGEISELGYVFVEGFYSCFGKNDWGDTEESAIKKAQDKRNKKISSLKKQIDKLERLQFTIKP